MASEEEEAEDEAALASVSANVRGGGMKTASRDDEKDQMNWRPTIRSGHTQASMHDEKPQMKRWPTSGSGNTQASADDEKTQMNWRPTIGSGNTQASTDDEKTQMNWRPTIGSGNTPASGGQMSRVGAIGGPMEPTAASTTMRGHKRPMLGTLLNRIFEISVGGVPYKVRQTGAVQVDRNLRGYHRRPS